MGAITVSTASEKILLAAFQLHDKGQTPFSAELLIVTVWQQYPDTFGLRYYANEHPDSNKVLTSLMGQRGLTQRGWLAKAGQKQYTITREGQRIARRLLALDGEEPEPLTPEQTERLEQLLASNALDKLEQNLREDLTFVDACRFWGVTEDLSREDVDQEITRVQDILAEIAYLTNEGPVTLNNSRVITKAEVDLLQEVIAFLDERFSRHLNLLRNRAARRSAPALQTAGGIQLHNPH